MACISIKNKIISRSMLVGNSAYIPVTPTVDYLIVAGGGGGGSSAYVGGGGAGGGFRTATSFAVTAGTPLTVTVGAGGAGGASATSNGSKGSDSVF